MRRAIESDVCIIGSGITAAMVADRLARTTSARIVVVEAGDETVPIADRAASRERFLRYGENPWGRDHIDGYEVVASDADHPGELIRVRLKYTSDRRSAISGLKRVSRPGRRTYAGAQDIPKVLGGMGTAIVSTSRGVMTGHEARSAGVGGEVVAHIW